MLHDFLFSPFTNPLIQQQYARLRAALRADAHAPETLLLGNFAVEENGAALEAVVVRPHSVTILLLVPGGGKLQMPALGYGAWQLGGQPLAGSMTGADNPYEQFRQQKAALAAWLETQFEPVQANFQCITGLVVFGAPVTFGPEVEGQLQQQPDGRLQLLSEVAHLSERLAQLAQPEINFSDADLSQWAQTLAEEPVDDRSEEPPTSASASPLKEELPARSFWRKAWGWLGAEDIPEDPPYGHPAAQAAASSAEKRRLEHMQQQAQAQVQQQLRAMEAREAERERRMEELRAQLAQAPLVTTETRVLRERLAAESQEKAALEDAIRASRTESDARSRDLDTKIKQLSQLIEQLNSQATASAAAAASRPTISEPRGKAGPLRAAAGYRRVRQWRRRLPRVAAAVGVAGLLGLGVWGISHLTAGPPAPYQENGKWGLADASGKAISAAKYSAVGPVQQQRAVVEQAGAYGVIDDAGKEVVAPAYDALNPYAEGYARVRVGDTYTFVDTQGQEFADYYFNALDFAEGVAAVLDNRGWHYISGPAPESPARPPVLFKEAYAFRNGLARVRLADGYTYITKDYLENPAEGTAPFGRYEAATDFEDGKAHVTQKGRRFIIDTDGDPVK
jgi:hypothetical protein